MSVRPSFPRKRDSKAANSARRRWTPAFAGVTVWRWKESA
jgi:hypothetical protein